MQHDLAMLKSATMTLRHVIRAVVPEGEARDVALELSTTAYRAGRDAILEEGDIADRFVEEAHASGRLVFDPEVSATSPVVKGTWITADHLAALIVDGWTWADILRSHPELVEDDIRACLTHLAAEDAR